MLIELLLFCLLRRTLGTPDVASWPEVVTLPDYSPTFPQWPSKPLESVVPTLCPAGVDLLAVCCSVCARVLLLVRKLATLPAHFELFTFDSHQCVLSLLQVASVGYLSFHPMAQCAVHALKGLACQSFSRTPRSQKTLHVFNGSKT